MLAFSAYMLSAVDQCIPPHWPLRARNAPEPPVVKLHSLAPVLAFSAYTLCVSGAEIDHPIRPLRARNIPHLRLYSSTAVAPVLAFSAYTLLSSEPK